MVRNYYFMLVRSNIETPKRKWEADSEVIQEISGSLLNDSADVLGFIAVDSEAPNSVAIYQVFYLLRLVECIRSGQSANVENKRFDLLAMEVCEIIGVLFHVMEELNSVYRLNWVQPTLECHVLSIAGPALIPR